LIAHRVGFSRHHLRRFRSGADAPHPSGARFIGRHADCWNKGVRKILVIPLSLFCGCQQGAEGPAVTGIYRLEVMTVSDTCTPAHGTAAVAFVPVVSTGDSLRIAVPRATHVELDISVLRRGFADTWLHQGWQECGRVSHRRAFRLLEESPESFEVRLTDAWVGVETCMDPTLPVERDCRGEYLLSYDLVRACGEPCEMRSSD
jgi:hypothetical protein